MNKIYTKVILLLLLLPCIGFGQNTLIYSNDFDNSTGVTLNSSVFGANTGPNRWGITNLYIGQPLFPNTISQDSTFGGTITNANGNYLHIFDSNISGIANANFDPNQASDRFTTLGPFCTQGDDSVHFAFFYLCQGNANSYGQVYYKANNGAWTLLATDSGTYKWKYQDITNPAFANVANLMFGFRWVNGVSTDTTESFAIDNVTLAATYDPVNIPINITFGNIYTPSVCAGSDSLEFDYTISDTLCGNGIYEYQLSSPGGSFTPYHTVGGLILDNSQLYRFIVNVPIPANSAPNSCYRMRVVRTDVTPNIISDSSDCFEVLHCTSSIFAQPPAIFSKTGSLHDTVCVGSVIDVPFLSFGGFLPGNNYVAQLSDSTGQFTDPINILGSKQDDATYNDPTNPGSIAGTIVPTSQPIPPGCNYYIRVISTRQPADFVDSIGPFCIRNCDILTNQMQDVHACISATAGQDITIPVNIHQADSSIVYSPTDSFQVQVLRLNNFNVLNTDSLGFAVSSSDTSLIIHVPNLAKLLTYGLTPGVYYLRVIATSSSAPWNSLGTVVRLTIGSPFPSAITIYDMDPNNINHLTLVPYDTICSGTIVYFRVDPLAYNQLSTYSWYINGNFWNNDQNVPPVFDYTAVDFNSPNESDFEMTVQETNFGCVGPGSDTLHIHENVVPPVSINGLTQICKGDTIHFSVPPSRLLSYYTWSSTADTIATLGNSAIITFPNAGPQQVHIHALDECGDTSSTKTINVNNYPAFNLPPDTAVCNGNSITLSGPSTPSGNLFHWSNGSSTSSITVQPSTPTTYTVSARTRLGGCTTKDSIHVRVQNPFTYPAVTDSLCADSSLTLEAAIAAAATYHWSPNGETSHSIRVTSAGSYNVSIQNADSACADTRQYEVVAKSCPVFLPVFPNVFTPNHDGRNETWKNIGGSDYTLSKIKVFDRWGLIIFESEDSNFEWDGTNKGGKLVTEGVYYYEVTAVAGDSKREMRGSITVLK